MVNIYGLQIEISIQILSQEQVRRYVDRENNLDKKPKKPPKPGSLLLYN